MSIWEKGMVFIGPESQLSILTLACGTLPVALSPFLPDQYLRDRSGSTENNAQVVTQVRKSHKAGPHAGRDRWRDSNIS